MSCSPARADMPASECPQKAAGEMSGAALTFSETAKVMHITFACLLCKISNESETPGSAGASAHLATAGASAGGRSPRVRSALCPARCGVSPDRPENHSWSWRRRGRKKEQKPPLRRGASPQPRRGARWHGDRGHRIDGHWSF